MSIKEAAKRVLKEAGEPLSIKEITKRMRDGGLWKPKGETPESSVGSALYTDIDKKGDDSIFVQTATSTIGLRRSQSDSGDDSETYKNFLEAAEQVLDELDRREPMRSVDITRIALKRGLLKTRGKTPENTMASRLSTEVAVGGKSSRFFRSKRGHYGLAKWEEDKTGMERQIDEHNKNVEDALLSQLKSMDPKDFERLICKLLIAMGFEGVDEPKFSKDGGIDVRGTWLINGAVPIKVAIQAKRNTKGNVQSPVVQSTRGSLSIHDEQGWIMTTSDFSPGAKVEAEKSTKRKIILINGRQLVRLLVDQEIGIRSKEALLLELAPEDLSDEGKA